MKPFPSNGFYAFGMVAMLSLFLVLPVLAVEESSTTVHNKPKSKPKKQAPVMVLTNDDLPKNGHHYIMVPPESGPDVQPAPVVRSPSVPPPAPAAPPAPVNTPTTPPANTTATGNTTPSSPDR